jgi:serine-type D-Ala-D-Ala carboxypeptidase (penicillin-binding protein 5/6)
MSRLWADIRWIRFGIALIVSLTLLLPSDRSSQPVAAADTARFEPLSPPQISADAVFVQDATTGTELFARDADTPLPPASLTKLVAALVVVDRARLDDVVDITKDDLVNPEESQVGLVEGDRLTVRDLLIGTLVPSGNDATRALGRKVGGSALTQPFTAAQAVDSFVSMMNTKAKEVGATASHFLNPTGIDAEGHVMSARDVATITETALRNPVIAEIIAMPRAVLHSEKQPDGYSVTTTNLLLQEGLVEAGKTGSTPKAGGCLVTMFSVSNNKVVAVVLGSDVSEDDDGLQVNNARFDDTRALISAVESDYVWIDPSAPGVIAGLLDELAVWDVGLTGGSLLPVPAADATQIRYRIVLSPPSPPPSEAGEVKFYIGDRLLSQLPAIQLDSPAST